MTAKTGPGLIDVVLTFLSRLVLLVLTTIFFIGLVARRMWGRKEKIHE